MPLRGPLVPWFAIVSVWAASLQAITIDVRLYCEISGGCGPGDFFVDHPEALDALEFAARAFEPFSDSLSALPASPVWTATFTNPNTGVWGATVNSLPVAANTMVLFVGGYDMAGNQVGKGGPGLGTVSLSRGQGTVSGSAATDFATWGGSIGFDTLNNGAPRNWHFGINTSPGPGQVDFLTIAFHELAHVFGFGTSASFENRIVAGQYQGQAVVGLTGGAALDGDKDHWYAGTTSPPYADEPAAALTSTLLLGRRTLLTPLDYAALKDIGWQVPHKLLALHGDADGDGDVDGRDFLTWQRTVGYTGNSAGDMNGDLVVDEFDLWLWRNNHNQSVAVGTLTTNARIPEPSAFALAYWAYVLFFAGRRAGHRCTAVVGVDSGGTNPPARWREPFLDALGQQVEDRLL